MVQGLRDRPGEAARGHSLVTGQWNARLVSPECILY